MTTMTPFSLLFASVFLIVTHAQSPCSPIDDGPFLGTSPTLNMDVYEATAQELASQPSQYRAEVRVHGQVGGQGSQGIVLEVMPDYQFMNPEDTFRFENVNGTNYLQMYQALDRDGPTAGLDDDTNTFTFTLKCSVQSNMSDYRYFDARIFVLDQNDNDPMFMNLSSMLTVNELSPAGTTVLMVKAEDKDLHPNLTFSVIPQTQLSTDMSDLFEIDSMTGELKVKGHLDYETMSSGVIVLSVEDNGSPSRSATATLTVTVEDGDDQGPAFVYPGCWTYKSRCSWPKYTAGNVLKQNQAIKVFPVPNKVQAEVKIRAKDLDLVHNPISFSIASTIPPGSEAMFTVTTAQTGMNGEYEATITPKQAMTVNHGFEIFLQAEEHSAEKRFEVAMIFFEDPQHACASGQSQGLTETETTNDNSSKMVTEKYSEPIVALIVVVAILAAIVLCLAVAFVIVQRRKSMPHYGGTSSDLNLRHTENGNSARL